MIKIADNIKVLKANYLEQCPFVGIILDEGNNYRLSCPLYVATISCDREFNWRVQFIGQANCAGRKDGASVFVLTKEIFMDNGLKLVFEVKIFSAGTDGGSTM